MTFDRRFKELANAHDAIDRLREARERIVERDAARQRARDDRWRMVILAILAVVIFLAYLEL